ncbi:glycoside hydrolase [Sanghuangporus baumii]|uniref:Glycoside hydrolase n=1 Tax=Sanghuangporus baumii TaxID=108892 RepID=A0A9Q5N9Q1_SANBA|nr:glycoside hydrolase [Sanghuangporus baumii]
MQSYNQQGYTDYTTLLTKSKAASKASVFEISESGVDLIKIVIGKPGIATDAGDSYMSQRRSFAGEAEGVECRCYGLGGTNNSLLWMTGLEL